MDGQMYTWIDRSMCTYLDGWMVSSKSEASFTFVHWRIFIFSIDGKHILHLCSYIPHVFTDSHFADLQQIEQSLKNFKINGDCRDRNRDGKFDGQWQHCQALCLPLVFPLQTHIVISFITQIVFPPTTCTLDVIPFPIGVAEFPSYEINHHMVCLRIEYPT